MLATRSLPLVLTLALVSGCGPAIEPSNDGTGGASDSTSSSTTSTSTSTSSTSSSTSADDTSDDMGVVFLIEPDGGILCSVAGEARASCPCSFFSRYCAPGYKCMPFANDGGEMWNDTHCTPIAEDPGQPGDACTVDGSPSAGIDDCDMGSMCFHVDPETNTGTCVAMCMGDPNDPSCDPGMGCMLTNNGVLLLCLDLCDPLVPNACPEGEACRTMDRDDDPVCIGGAGVEIRPCGAAACSPDQACVDDSQLEACMEYACCSPWCDLTAPDPNAPCAAEPTHSCQPYYAPEIAPAGLEHLGVCRLP